MILDSSLSLIPVIQINEEILSALPSNYPRKFFLANSIAITLVQAIILCHLNICNNFLNGFPVSTPDYLQSSLNRVVRVILSKHESYVIPQLKRFTSSLAHSE